MPLDKSLWHTPVGASTLLRGSQRRDDSVDTERGAADITRADIIMISIADAAPHM